MGGVGVKRNAPPLKSLQDALAEELAAKRTAEEEILSLQEQINVLTEVQKRFAAAHPYKVGVALAWRSFADDS
jgi:hypothetical protein